MQIYFFFLNLISFLFFLAFVTVHLLVKGKVLSRQLRRVRPHPNVKKKKDTHKILYPPKMAGPRLGTSGLLMVLFCMASTSAMGKYTMDTLIQFSGETKGI